MIHLLLTAALALIASDQDPIPSLLEERDYVEAVIDWPFSVEAKSKKHTELCRSLVASEIRILENGADVMPIELGLADRKTVHVLLIDTSGSMAGEGILGRRRLKQTKSAAKTYIDQLIESGRSRTRDEVMVLTFDNDLIMHAPRSSLHEPEAVERVKQRIDAIEGGYDTAFLDALHRLVYYLGTYPERFAMVLLSDGADNVSVVPEDDVKRLIAETNNLTIFAIGLGLPEGPHQDLLKYLARVSGGRYYWVRAHRKPAYLGEVLERPFTSIQRHLATQYHAAYRPLSEIARGFLDVKITSRNSRCKVTLHKPQRYVEEEDERSTEAPGRVNGEVVSLDVRDIVRDAGPLAVWARDAQIHDFGRETQTRTVIVTAPHERETSTPLAVIEWWLQNHRDSARLIENPFLINGKTFPYLRPALAGAVYRAYRDHRAWLRRRMEPQVRAEYRATLPPETTNEQFEAIVQARLDHPRSLDLQRYLASWRGDVRVRDLAFQLERAWANEWLAEPGGFDPAHRRRQWRRLAKTTFRPPDRVRIVTPLRLTYDADRDEFGYYRVLLPPLRQIPHGNFPERPLGLELVWWLADETIDTPRDRQWRVMAVEHHVLSEDELPPDRTPVPRDLQETVSRITLVIEAKPGHRTILEVLASTESDEFAPQCVLSISGELTDSLAAATHPLGFCRSSTPH